MFTKSRPERRSVVLFLAAFCIRCLLVLATDQLHQVRWYEANRMGWSLAQTGVMGNPFLLETGPSAHLPPLYVLFLGAVYKVAGSGFYAEIWKQGFTAVVVALRCALMPWLCRRLSLPKEVGLIAGVLSVFWISALETELRGDWETPLLALLLLALTGFQAGRPLAAAGIRESVLRGLLWGVTALVNPVVLAVWAATLFLDLARDGRRILGRAVFASLVLFLVLLPWGVRNRISLGGWVFTRSNFGLELWVAYHPGAHWANVENLRTYTVHPINSPQEAKLVVEQGELAYNRKKARQALAWMGANPAETLRLAGLHFWHFWFPPSPSRIHQMAGIALTLAAFCGAALLAWRRIASAAPLGVVLAAFPLVYYLMSWSSRYRYPIEWAVLILAAMAFWEAWSRFRATFSVQSAA